jgi:hypothetical protein
MVAFTEERNRILHMIESHNLTAAEAVQLLDALESEQKHVAERSSKHIVRIRVTTMSVRRQKANVTVPVELIGVGVRLATRLAPQVSGSALEDLLRAIENGRRGRLLDLQDLELDERVEIFVE